MLKSNQTNGFASPDRRTVANDADGKGEGQVPTVRANPLKSNAEIAADGADANLASQSGVRKNGCGRLEGADMNGADVLKAARAAGVELALKDDVLVLEAPRRSK
jgi:hypothetical protein